VRNILGYIQQYFNRELDQDLAQFDAEFDADFFSEPIGGLYYNSALKEAQAVLENKLEEISGAINEIEKPISSRLLRTRQ
jgi:uncharacterized protein (DUF2164 family)